MRITISRSMGAFGVLALMAVTMAAGIGALALSQLRVGGDVYSSIVKGKELIAEVFPPSLYVSEAYLHVHRMEDKHGLSTQDVEALKQLKINFDQVRRKQLAGDLPGDVKRSLEHSLEAADEMWRVVMGPFVAALGKGDRAAVEAVVKTISELFAEHKTRNDAVIRSGQAYLASVEMRADGANWTWHAALLATLIAAGLVVALGIYAMHRRVSAPVQRMTSAMKAIAAGDLAVEVPAVGRDDEIGEMADAVQYFKQAAMEKKRLEAEAAARLEAENAERARREAESAKRLADLDAFLASFKSGLEELAAGNLQVRINTPYAPEYEPLRESLNLTAARLQETIATVVQSAGSLRDSAHEITSSADDMSLRTEQQAAALEQAAASLDEITMTVKRTADGATHAAEVADAASKRAEESEDIVRQAVVAMNDIEKSSNQISQIIGVIDEIAFQTNLLALNAGVEAARAGDAGRGFAVVASEVRALAQRSADAAKEIKSLISASSDQVSVGVDRVGKTGEALTVLLTQVAEINKVIADITASAKEQAIGLAQVNTAVTQMDQTTQQNAAMAEESTAASHSLAAEADRLNTLTAAFRIGDRDASPVRLAAVSSPAKRTPRASSAPVRVGNTLRKPASDADSWRDF